MEQWQREEEYRKAIRWKGEADRAWEKERQSRSELRDPRESAGVMMAASPFILVAVFALLVAGFFTYAALAVGSVVIALAALYFHGRAYFERRDAQGRWAPKAGYALFVANILGFALLAWKGRSMAQRLEAYTPLAKHPTLLLALPLVLGALSLLISRRSQKDGGSGYSIAAVLLHQTDAAKAAFVNVRGFASQAHEFASSKVEAVDIFWTARGILWLAFFAAVLFPSAVIWASAVTVVIEATWILGLLAPISLLTWGMRLATKRSSPIEGAYRVDTNQP